ncbi:unnamed protein product [Pocillopora meandrina]|uniref:Secreted protein n=1 Tax=Pocillopora meandrina TaxID=46732 RepID=A0AAU9VLX3_9CNID|nr:unnamed protein product [Pocillopora meandrina]
MKVFVVRKSGNFVSLSIQVFSQFALISGCWKRPITRTGSSKAKIITPETSKLSVFCFICFLVRWCWEYLGKHFRVAVPSSVVNNIRKSFPADFGSPYTGLKLLNL